MPKTATGVLWDSVDVRFSSNWPMRGPITSTAASATQPPMLWTTVDPAKSMKPSSCSHPIWVSIANPPQAQWPNTG